jgi:hypothetical protein
MERIENRTFGELEPGDTASLVRTYKDIEVFAIMSGARNPITRSGDNLRRSVTAAGRGCVTGF